MSLLALRRHRTAATTVGTAAPTARIAALDGLRGVAIVLVVMHHSAVTARWPIGVDLFFCLTGLLITAQITRRCRARRFTLGGFYRQRFKRLAPLLGLTLALTIAAVLLLGGDLEARRTGRQALASMLQVANWEQTASGQGYWDAFGRILPLNHMWSLSVTEQFYLLWPLLVVLVYRCARRPERALALCSALGFATAALAAPLGWAGTDPDALYMNSAVRSVAFFAGALAALYKDRGHDHAPEGTARTPAAAVPRVAAYGALLGLAVLGGLADSYREPWLYQGGTALIAFLAAVLAATATATVRLRRVLEHGVLVGLGRISYALYLIHLPVFWLLLVLYPAASPAALLVVGGTVSCLVAHVLHHRVQERLRRRSWTLRRHGAATVAALALLACGALGLAPAVAWRTHVPGRTGVVVLGDSVANNLADALRQDGGGRWNVVDGGIPGCGISGADAVRVRSGLYPVPASCQNWPRRWSGLLTRTQVRAIVVDLSWDEGDQRVGGDWLTPCTAAYRDLYRGRLDRARRLWRTAAPGVPVLITDHGTGSLDTTATSTRCFNQIIGDFVHHTQGTHLLDLDALLCPMGHCIARTGTGLPVFTDGTHFTPAGEELLEPWLDAALTGATRTAAGSAPRAPQALQPPG